MKRNIVLAALAWMFCAAAAAHAQWLNYGNFNYPYSVAIDSRGVLWAMVQCCPEDPDDPGSPTSGVLWRIDSKGYYPSAPFPGITYPPGLPPGAVYADHSDGIWYVPYGGGPFGRYDGSRWTVDSTFVGAQYVVHAALAARNGDMWFTFESAVARHDGLGWHTYAAPPELGRIVSLYEDTTGVVWCGGDHGGFGQFQGDGLRTSLLPALNGSNVSTTVNAILQDHRGATWFATTQGLFRKDASGWQQFVEGLPNPEIVSLLEDRSGALWCSTNDGVARYDGTSWQTFLSGPGRVRMVMDHRGVLWFARNDLSGVVVHRYDGFSWRSFPFAADSLTDLVADPGGGLWCANWGGASFNRYDDADWFNHSADLGGNGASVALQSARGVLWFGTPGGARGFDGEHWVERRFPTPDSSYPSGYAPSLYETRDGALWMSLPGNGGGVARTDTVGAQLFYDVGFPDEYIASLILEDRRGALWFKTTTNHLVRYQNGIWHRFAGSTLDGFPLLDGLSTLVEDSDGVLWCATDHWLCRYDATTEHWSVIPYSGINLLIADRVRGLWLSQGTLLIRFVEPTGGTVVFDAADLGWPGWYLSQLFPARDGSIWFITQTGSWTPDTKVGHADAHGSRVFATQDGLPNVTQLILEDQDGAIWFTNGHQDLGTFSFGHVRDAGGELQVASPIHVPEQFGREQQLLVQDRGGTLWFSVENGLVAHTPDHVAPRTAFDGRPATVSANRSAQASFFAAYERQPQFQYALNGGPWSPWSGSQIWSATGLQDGTYRFAVRARDVEGNVGPESAVEFEIDGTAPQINVRSLSDNAVVRDTLVIRGSAADARFAWYRVDHRRSGTGPWSAVTDTVRSPVANGILGRWPTKLVPDGPYELRFTIADTLGLLSVQVLHVVVDNQFPFVAQTSPALVTAALGGDIYTPEARVHLYLGPHALSRDTMVTLADQDSAAAPPQVGTDAVRLGVPVEVSWGSVQLDKPGVLDFAIPAGAKTPVVYEEGLDGWERIGGTMDRGRIAIPLLASGRYGLYEQHSELDGAPGLNAITLTPRIFSPRGTYASSTVAIEFTLGRSGPVSVRVYDLTGRLVRDVTDGLELRAGANVVRWDGRDRGGDEVKDGAYVVTVEGDGAIRKKTLAVVR